MRKLAITLALATTALGSPAAATDHAWYAGVEGGAMIVEDTHFNYSQLTAGVRTLYPNGVQIDHHTGFDGDIIGGYDFGMFRAEAEIGYKRAGIQNVTTNGGLATLRASPTPRDPTREGSCASRTLTARLSSIFVKVWTASGSPTPLRSSAARTAAGLSGSPEEPPSASGSLP